jgi:hypothetical protein
MVREPLPRGLKPSTSRQGGEQTIGPKCCDPMSEMGGGLNRSTQHFILKERWSVL